MHLFTPLLLIGATFVSIGQGKRATCNTTSNGFIAAEAPDYNNRVVSELLNNLTSLRTPGTAYATFDWDNTCMFGDMSATVVYYQVDNLNYRIPPSQFKELFSLGYTAENGDECLPQGINSVLGQDVEGKNVTMEQVLESASRDYHVLYDSYIGPFYKLKDGEAPSLDSVKDTETYRNFRAKLPFLIFGLGNVYGSRDELPCAIKIAMNRFLPLLVGMSELEIKQYIKNSVRWHLNAKLETPSFNSTGALAVKGTYEVGLRAFNGQETTMRVLRQQGVEVYVISSSPQIFVEQAASLMGLGFVVPSSNVFGIRFVYKDHKFTGQLIDNYPITWGTGKAEIVTKWIAPKHKNVAPIYASGDSNGDVFVFEQVRNGIVHINNRLMSYGSKIQTYYEKACLYFDTFEPETGNRYLLQGQDKEIGTWISSGFSTKNGLDYISGVSKYDGCRAYRFLW